MAISLPDLEAQLRLDVSQVTRAVGQVEGDLQSLSGGPDIPVSVDVSQALSQLSGLSGELQALPTPDVPVTVTADTNQAEAAVDAFVDGLVTGVAQGTTQARDEFGRFVRSADSAGGQAGSAAGGRMSEGITDNLKKIPLAGVMVGLGVLAAASLVSGFNNEVRVDLLRARTGLDEATAAKIGRAAGEAYGNNFGESIEANMDNARAAIQAGLLDPNDTQRDVQAVIEQLQGVADIMGEEVPAVARAASQAIKTGFAKDTAGAFDLLVKGTQAGLNASEDLLDTFNEYGTSFRAVGLEGPEALGLLSQAVKAGARDTDIAADAFKEFGIRAQDGSEASADAYKAIGLNAEEMTQKVASGGAGAREVLQTVLEGISAIEDPAERTAVAVGLFGTQAEDLAGAFAAFDLSTAVAQLGQVEGAAAGAISTLGDNAAGTLESARRNIEVATDGIKGAFAAAFSDEIKDFAAFTQENRGQIVRFVLDLADGALEMGIAFVEASASGLDSLGQLSGAVGDVALQLFDMFNALNEFGPFAGQLDAAVEVLGAAALSTKAIEEGTGLAADALRDNLIDGALRPAQAQLAALGDEVIAGADFHDATVRLANDVANIGLAANGSALALDTTSSSFDKTSAAGKALDDQLRTATDSLAANLAAAAAAGEGTDSLTATFEENRQSLVNQLTAMGFSTEAANALATEYGAVPSLVQTSITQPGMASSTSASRNLVAEIGRIPSSKSTSVKLEGAGTATEQAQRLRDAILGIPLSRTSSVRYRTIIENGGNVPGRAGGGPVYPGLGLTLVGEEGPELVAWGGVGTVLPAGLTSSLMGSGRTVSPGDGVVQAAGGGGMSVRVFIGDTELRGMVRAEVSSGLSDEADAMRVGRV